MELIVCMSRRFWFSAHFRTHTIGELGIFNISDANKYLQKNQQLAIIFLKNIYKCFFHSCISFV